MFLRAFQSEADGIRTRNHRIDSSVNNGEKPSLFKV